MGGRIALALVVMSVCAARPAAADRRKNTLAWEDIDVAVRHRSPRAVAEEFVVLPEGIDVDGRLRLVTADGGLGPGAIKLTDVALFDLGVHWALAPDYELDASISMLAKQPSTTSERELQGGSLSLSRALGDRTAIVLATSAQPLLGLRGEAAAGGLAISHDHRLNEIVTFTLTGGASTTWLRPTGATDDPGIVEAIGHVAVRARVPEGVWGAWLGAGYAIPVVRRGHDPVTGMSIDPQPRLDLNLGNAVRLADDWDLSAEVSIIDRGDLAHPATRLPVLDGGFDQIQVVIGVSRRFRSASRHATL